MITNHDGLLVGGDGKLVGYLFKFDGKQFSPRGDKTVGISDEVARRHNEMLAEGEILGLEASEIGQGGTFYWTCGRVQTWMGSVVSENVKLNGRSLTFWRKGKMFRGRLQKDGDMFNFRRVK